MIHVALLLAVQLQLEVVETCTSPVPPWSPKDLFSGLIENVQRVCPAWVTLNAAPAIINDFSRPSGDAFRCTAKLTSPGPLMLTGDCRVIQPEASSTVHEH